MSTLSKAALLPVCVLAGLHLLPESARAQSAGPATPAEAILTARPAEAAAAVPAALYRSSFSGYRSFSEPVVSPWRETNEQVRQRGGWRAYAREASEPAAASASAPTTAPPLSGLDHSGHRPK
jgi:hypothetical protein